MNPQQALEFGLIGKTKFKIQNKFIFVIFVQIKFWSIHRRVEMRLRRNKVFKTEFQDLYSVMYSLHCTVYSYTSVVCTYCYRLFCLLGKML